MDKKNTTIGIVLLLAGFVWLLLTPKITPPAQAVPEVAAPGTGSTLPPAPTPSGSASGGPGATIAAAPTGPATEGEITVLQNEYFVVSLTSAGGAIRDVALKRYAKTKEQPDEPYVVNSVHADPALAITALAGMDQRTAYKVSATANEVVYTATWDGRVEVIRRYGIETTEGKDAEPYRIRHETTFRNLTAQPLTLPLINISLGTAAPLHAQDNGLYLVTGYNDGEDTEFVRRSSLEGGGFLSAFGIGNRQDLPELVNAGAMRWTSVNNQFFTSILSPAQPATGLVTRRVQLAPPAGGLAAQVGITGTTSFQVPEVPANGEAKLAMGFYVGPKDYKRLSNTTLFKADEDRNMQFGFFRLFAQMLLTIMVWMHSWTQNWGVAIILATLTLKIAFLWPTISASKSAKRMAKLQPEMQAIREKYKDNPQKLQTETMGLFKKYKVNPAGGCLPILLTMPFFFGFYSMLQSTTDLRFAEFLWAKDLSAPDTVVRIYGLPVNIMPLLLGATMIIQMRIVPTPTVDNMQMKMMKFMPWIFTIFCYNLPAGLSLYSTINGLFTIGQQLVINRMKDEELVAVTPSPKTGKPVKNVTPRK